MTAPPQPVGELLVTLVGPTTRADVAFDPLAPSGACAAAAAALLAEPGHGPWALACVDGEPWPADEPAVANGAVDGSWLHLVDLTRPRLRPPVPEAAEPHAAQPLDRFGSADPLRAGPPAS